MNNGAAVSAAVAGEAIDIGKSSTMPLVEAHARGLPFTLIAPANMWLKDYVARNRDVVQRFLGVLYRAQVYTSAHHAETVDALAAFTGIEAATIAQMTRATPGALLDARDLAPVIDAAVKAKAIDRAFDPHELISPAALKAAP